MTWTISAVESRSRGRPSGLRSRQAKTYPDISLLPLSHFALNTNASFWAARQSQLTLLTAFSLASESELYKSWRSCSSSRPWRHAVTTNCVPGSMTMMPVVLCTRGKRLSACDEKPLQGCKAGDWSTKSRHRYTAREDAFVICEDQKKKEKQSLGLEPASTSHGIFAPMSQQNGGKAGGKASSRTPDFGTFVVCKMIRRYVTSLRQ